MLTKNRFIILFQLLFLVSGGVSGVQAGAIQHLETMRLLPDLQTLPPEELLLLASQTSEKKLLRFSNSVANLGQGPAVLLGKFDQKKNTVQISQNVYRADGSSFTREVGEFVFHREHDHWHWDDFALYEVWTVSVDGELLDLVSSSGKVGYCLRDDDPLPEDPSGNQLYAARAVYLGCGWRRQGISVGWMDTYARHTPGQFVDISGAPDGLYALRSTVDPDNRLLELDEANNSAVLFFTLQRNKLEVIGDSIKPLPDGPDHPG
jgi:hypothetical protein